MKKILIFLSAVFFGSVLLLSLQKPLFMLYNWAESSSLTLTDWLAVMWHGLWLDFTVAGYITAIPTILCMVAVWLRSGAWRVIFNLYTLIITVFVSLAFVVNMSLYPFWGYTLDSSIFQYLKSPKEVQASISWWFMARQTLFCAAYGTLFYLFFKRFILPLFEYAKPIKYRVITALALILFAGVLFLPIRGGVSASTANVGRVYFSPNMFLNHAAVNPCFSLISSAVEEPETFNQFHFFSEQELQVALSDMPFRSELSTTRKLLKTDRPNILIVILESFSANTIEALGGDKGVTPTINALSEEGVLFRNLYSSSFRTDRGLVAVLNGYPGQPTTSIMKYPTKTKSLHSIASKLRNEGYSTAMYYGGDIDFTNMRSYFYSSGYQNVIGQDRLLFNDKKSRWGYNDALMFDYVFGRIAELPKPFLATFLTLSSHEPFDVPFKKFDDPYVNSIAFTDHCIGLFIDSLKHTPLWNDLLVVMISDHGFRYPENIGNNSAKRQHIPMLWVGGALKEHKYVDNIGAQTDLAATLMAQLNINPSDFIFSRNLLDSLSGERAVYTFNNGVGIVDKAGTTIYDFTMGALIDSGTTAQDSARVVYGKAFVQRLMSDLENR